MIRADASEERAPRAGSTCVVELYGIARMLAGARQVVVDLQAPAPLDAVVVALAERCPALSGAVLDVPRGRLAEGYIFNRNGRDFLTGADPHVQPGDRLLLLSSGAGG